ncbi:GGDEF domain-containing protein [Geminicoccaceae bacterium 1502E]|nr:GGDEF domain-containing protein [Geminicoccaceae bacterium 1502E]
MRYISFSLLLLFSAACFCVWLPDRERREVLLFAGAFLSYAVATLCQIAAVPPDPGHNALTAAALYAAGAFLLHQGILVRSRRAVPLTAQGVMLAGVVAAVWYFQYVEPNLLLRVCALNLGLAAIYLQAAWHTRFLLRGNKRDRVLFWLLVGLVLHYIPRMLLTTAPLAGAPGDSLALFTESHFWTWAQFSLAVTGAAVGLVLLAVTAADMIARLERERDRDPLTGLLNRRGLEAWLTRRRAEGAAGRLAVLAFDIDHFKRINDTFGHRAGDGVLAAVAGTIVATISRGALGRIGGEEFVVLVDDVTAEGAFAAAERLRTAIGRQRLEGLARTEPITCSFGVAMLEPGESLWAAFERADRLLYAAKRAGRNRTFVEGRHRPAA